MCVSVNVLLCVCVCDPVPQESSIHIKHTGHNVAESHWNRDASLGCASLNMCTTSSCTLATYL